MALTDDQMNSNSPLSLCPNNPAEISIVVPAHNEAGNLRKLHMELIKVLPSLNIPWEIIFVDDGSTDNTWKEITSLHKVDNTVKGLRFSRNFGHQFALLAGLSHASGKAVISIDADLQHPPQLIPQLVENWRNGSKIVHTIRADPEDFSFFKKTASKLYYKVFSFLSGFEIAPGMADFRLLDRQVLNSILQLPESALFLRGIVQWVGYPSSSINFQSSTRNSGTSSYTFRKMLRLGWDGISSFSIIPLRVSTLIGILTSAVAFSGIVYALYSKLITGTAVSGWASSLVFISFLFGILFILLGLIGEYIGRILIEVKQRPRFVISEHVGSHASDDCENSDISSPGN